MDSVPGSASSLRLGRMLVAMFNYRTERMAMVRMEYTLLGISSISLDKPSHGG